MLWEDGVKSRQSARDDHRFLAGCLDIIQVSQDRTRKDLLLLKGMNQIVNLK
jgi:hypothetical protein